jgi:tetratricopeptide (TPR) repeat protein
MTTSFQRVAARFVVIWLVLIGVAMSAWSSEPLHVYYRYARKNLADAMMEADNKLHKGDFEGARRTTDAMVKTDPTFYVAYYLRAEAFMQQHKYLEAARDCNTALRMDPTFGEAALLRARVNYHLGRYDESLKEIDHVAGIPLRPDARARAYRDRAELRLYCPDRSYRDPHQAVNDAAMACRLIGWRDEDMIDILATAYAEIGDFDSAVRYEEKALSIKGVKSDDAKRLQAHLDSFKQHKAPR